MMKKTGGKKSCWTVPLKKEQKYVKQHGKKGKGRGDKGANREREIDKDGDGE